MDDQRKNHVRAWRKHRGLSQEAVAKELDTAKGVISLLENSKRPLSDKWLDGLAKVLGTTRGDLLDNPPKSEEPPPPKSAIVLEIFDRIEEKDHEQAMRILETFAKPKDVDEKS